MRITIPHTFPFSSPDIHPGSSLWPPHPLQGSQLEPQLGTLAFARLVAELAFVGNFLYLAAAALLAQQLPALGFPLMRTCCVGFSGVLFGMKVG